MIDAEHNVRFFLFRETKPNKSDPSLYISICSWYDNKEQEFNACAASHVDCKFGSSVTYVMHRIGPNDSQKQTTDKREERTKVPYGTRQIHRDSEFGIQKGHVTNNTRNCKYWTLRFGEKLLGVAVASFPSMMLMPSTIYVKIFDDLYLYCYYVAGAVGAYIMLPWP
ncbi:hypothetical protein E2542_SST29419 [Spatholobus suberectus]|nr:hypothetical protein E2542_SST29419 [Spatholobus suberectus]